ncbi:HLJ1_G0050880.mRNA.1.CDS.1 [Saccharomyces cerevisiae]|nr:HLJ1_G0050880.mRNA.1.CDS.1 [Saccharomyces cerevisiae]
MDNRFHKHIFHQVSTLNVNNVRMVEEQLMILVPWCPFSRPGAVDKTTKTGTDVAVTPGFTKIVISQQHQCYSAEHYSWDQNT